MGGVRCAAKGCDNMMKKQKQFRYHRFPFENDRSIEWLKLCGRDDLVNLPMEYINRNFRLCSAHFESKMYANPEMTRLLPLAMPSIFDENCEQDKTENISSDVIPDEHIQDTPTINCEDLLIPLSNITSTISDNSDYPLLQENQQERYIPTMADQMEILYKNSTDQEIDFQFLCLTGETDNGLNIPPDSNILCPWLL